MADGDAGEFPEPLPGYPPNHARRRFLTVATSIIAGAGAGAAAVPFLSSWQPNAAARAAGAPVRMDVSRLERGGMAIIGWRGKPVYVLRRSAEQLAALGEQRERLADPDSLRSEQPAYVQPAWRSLNPEYFIVVGLCTHLGCTPKLRDDLMAGNGGFFCPCHGSMFDLAGRVLQGMPAPKNLAVPPHRYESETVLIIGVDSEASA